MRFLNRTAAINAIVSGGILAAVVAITTGGLLASPIPPVPAGADPADPQRVESPLSLNAAAVAYARHTRALDQLGFPVGVRRSATHVKDGYLAAEYDEVSELDNAGHPASLTQFDADGRMRAAIRFDRTPTRARTATSAQAAKAAEKSARAVGLVSTAPATAQPDDASGGWVVNWPRAAAGVRVRGDGTLVVVRSDGSIQSVARVEHQLAAAPKTKIGVDRARQVVKSNADVWFAGQAGPYAIDTPQLQWVEPTSAFGPGPLTDTAKPYRLAWVATVKPTGAAAEYVTLISVFVDASDGTIIGGDFVE